MCKTKTLIKVFILILNCLYVANGSTDNYFCDASSNLEADSPNGGLTRSNSSHSTTSSVEWLNNVEEHWNNLVEALENRKPNSSQGIKKSRLKGNIPTAERILTSLTNLLNHFCTCTATIIGPDQRLWIAYNADKCITKKKLSTVLGHIQLLLKPESVVSPKRKSMIKNKDVLKILEMCTDVGRSKKTGVTKAFGKAADKLITNIKKLLQLKTYNGKDKKLLQLKKALKEANISYYSGGLLRKEVQDETEGFCVHAEMNFLQILSETKKPKEFNSYLAISRLCCRKCAAAIETFNSSQKKVCFTAPGSHGNDYIWPIPEFIKKAKYLKYFIGDDAYSVYKKQNSETKKDFLDKISKLTKDGSRDTRIPITTTESQEVVIAESHNDSNNSTMITFRKKKLQLKTEKRKVTNRSNK